MATKVPVRSILKQPKPTPAKPNPDQAKSDRDRHNYNLALQHAHLIQNQKDWQAKILHTTEVLLDYPSDPTFSPTEAKNFTTLIQPFQPSDLDALIEERVIVGRCGYVLCAKQPRSATGARDADWRVGKGAANFCSGACAGKSSYAKAQLSGVPVWERDPSVIVRILLPEEDRLGDEGSVGVEGERVAGGKRKVAVAVADANREELAMERGEKATSFRPRQVMTERIVEKATTTFKPLSSVSGADVSHTAIEGYEPQGVGKGKIARDEDSDSDDDEGVDGTQGDGDDDEHD